VDDRAFRRYAQHYDKRVQNLAQQLADGSITSSEWRNGMAQEIRQIHLTADIIGHGGLDNYDAQALDRLNARVQEQLGYLDNWKAQIDRDGVTSADAVSSRGRLYAGNANATLQHGKADAMGLPALPSQPGDGTTSCLTNCKCRWSIRKDAGDGNYTASWRLGAAEHCPECVRRATAWRDIKIRDGVIVSNISGAGLFA